ALPVLKNVEITPIGLPGAVVFNPATDVQSIPSKDSQGRPIVTFVISALLQRIPFEMLQFRVRITVASARGDCTTRDFFVKVHCSVLPTVTDVPSGQTSSGTPGGTPAPPSDGQPGQRPPGQ